MKTQKNETIKLPIVFIWTWQRKEIINFIMPFSEASDYLVIAITTLLSISSALTNFMKYIQAAIIY